MALGTPLRQKRKTFRSSLYLQQLSRQILQAGLLVLVIQEILFAKLGQQMDLGIHGFWQTTLPAFGKQTLVSVSNLQNFAFTTQSTTDEAPKHGDIPRYPSME